MKQSWHAYFEVQSTLDCLSPDYLSVSVNLSMVASHCLWEVWKEKRMRSLSRGHVAMMVSVYNEVSYFHLVSLKVFKVI